MDSNELSGMRGARGGVGGGGGGEGVGVGVGEGLVLCWSINYLYGIPTLGLSFHRGKNIYLLGPRGGLI